MTLHTISRFFSSAALVAAAALLGSDAAWARDFDLERCASTGNGQMAILCQVALDLQAQIDALEQVVEAADDGSVRIFSAGDLFLQSGAANEISVLGDTMLTQSANHDGKTPASKATP